MESSVDSDLIYIIIGVAVFTEMGTGVVGSYVCSDVAGAIFSGWLVLGFWKSWYD